MIYVDTVIQAAALQLAAIFVSSVASRSVPCGSLCERVHNAERLLEFVSRHLPSVHLYARSGEDVNPPDAPPTTELEIKGTNSIEKLRCRINWSVQDPHACLKIVCADEPLSVPYWKPFDPFRDRLWTLPVQPQKPGLPICRDCGYLPCRCNG